MEDHPTLKTVFRDGPDEPWCYRTKEGKGITCAVKGCRKIRNLKAKDCFCHRCRKSLQRLNNPLQALYSGIRNRARKKKQVFDWTFADFKSFAIEHGYADNHGRYKGCLHVDRINPLEGYHPGNVRVLEAGENSSKGAGEDKKAHWLAARRGRGEVVYEQPVLVPVELDPNYVGF